MRFILYFLTLAILCVPSWVNATERSPKAVTSTTPLYKISLKALLPNEGKRFVLKSTLADAPPQWMEKKEPEPRQVYDAEFFRRAQTRYIYGE
ncbi:MAG: hypothetical protein H6617_10910 [Bdellovibrionaceae bacterium]|nr:hypothetical protein [Bdellovibrionales bacterium]MCB9255182.1 hypothetical protein [Pseudobdellovibrionaceae bacterium]